MTSLPPPPCIGGRKQPVQSSTNHLQSTLPRRASTPFPMHRTRARALRLQHVSPQGSVQRSLVGHPALCTSSTLGLGTQRTQLENHARTACRTPPRPLVGHPALCTSSTLALEPANATRHECRANAFEDIATNRLRYPPAASRPTFRPPFPRRSPCALHFVDPGRPACECHAAQTRANTFAEIATNRPRLPQRSAHQSPVGHPALCTSSTLAVEPANTTPHECRANTFADIATNRLRGAPAASPQPSRPPFPRRSPGALHLVDPGSGPADPKGRKLNAHPGGPVTRARPATHWQCQQNAPRSSPSHPRQSALSAWPEQCCIFVNTDGPRAKSHSGGASMKAVQRVDRMKPRSR